MTDFHHTRCDWCEATFVGETGRLVSYEDIYEAGWVQLLVDWDSEEETNLSLDFCSKRCLTGWLLMDGAAVDAVVRSVEE